MSLGNHRHLCTPSILLCKKLSSLLLCLIANMALAQNSVLNQGNWYKLGITEKGVYQLGYTFFQENNIDISSIDPRHIRVFGNGGGMLPQPNDAPRPDGLQENAIFIQGEGDGSFDPQDFVLFYGQSPDQLALQSDGTPIYQKNLYSDTVYYFLTIGNTPGLRISEKENLAGNYPRITSFDDLMAHEEELEKVVISGREWYGERFSTGLSQNFTFDAPRIKENSNLEVIVDVLNRSQNEATFSVALNGNQLGEIPMEAIAEGTYTRKGKEAQKQFTANSNTLAGSQEIVVNLQFNGSGIGHLNWLLIKCQRNLAMAGPQTVFRSLSSLNHPVSTFSLANASEGIAIWDITDPLRAKKQTFTLADGTATFNTSSVQLHEYIAFQDTEFLQPMVVTPVPNQNLHAAAVPEMLIVTAPSLLSQAERLAAFRQQNNGMDVLVTTTSQVFNEFSSGAQDVTAIRDFVKYLYDQNPEKLKYLLLFGKGTYDYKDKVDDNPNLVPIYESRNSLDPIFSFSSDDYYGLLETAEGEWDENLEGESTLEIGVGRLPVKNLQEAATIVDKLILYATAPESLGKWRNNVYFVADDGDGDRHQKDADFLARFVDTAHTAVNVNKIYMDAFPQQSQASGEIAPDVNKSIEEAIEKGTLLINYTGHGGELGWAEERILDLEMINSWENKYKLPFFVTATCEFGRHDDPRRVSGAEQLILNKNGGAIGLVTTTRPVFSSTNFSLNKAFYQKVFDKSSGKYPTLGEIFRFTKNNSKADRVNRNFSLLGDPSMQLAYPEKKIVIDSIEDISSGAFSDTLKALSKIKLYGNIIDEQSQTVSPNFDGIVEVTVYDKPVQTKTLGNEGTTMQFAQRNSVIHRGQATVKAGQFTMTFVVPKNIAYQKDFGKISLYAWQSEKPNQPPDAGGALNTLVVGGSNKNVMPDNIPPDIELFMDDESFANGGITGTNTRLLAKLSDESGISISQNGLGQNIVATLIKDTEEIQEFSLNDFYTTDIDTYKSGKVMYPLLNLAEGKYRLEVKAWDTHNNVGKSDIEFTVVSEASLQISEFINYPNPVEDQTTFRVAHNRAGDDLTVDISIFSLQGQLVQLLTAEFTNSNARIDDLVWYGTNTSGARLRPGIYLAKVLVKSLQDGAKNEKYRKLVIIN